MRRLSLFPTNAIAVALTCSATIGAQFIVGTAVRDALFLANFDASALPLMIAGTAACSILLVFVSAKHLRGVSPRAYVPAGFAAGALLLLGVWLLAYTQPLVAAPALYLYVSGVGPMLGSGFWLIASHEFDPHTAKKRYGQIGAAGTIGGIVGGVAAAQISAAAGVESALPLLAVLNAVCAWQIRRLTGLASRASDVISPEPAAAPVRSGFGVLRETAYLRRLAGVVLSGTIAATFADYVLKVQVAATFGGPEQLAAFFSVYYAAINVLTFLIQLFASSMVLERLGLSAAMGAPSVVLAAGATGALVQPGLPSVVTMHAGEAVLDGSLLSSGYELLYTPIPDGDKRAVKALIDVGVDRSGDFIGALAIQVVLILVPDGAITALLWLVVVTSLIAAAAASRLGRGYVKALEANLAKRAVELDLSEVRDWDTRTAVYRTLRGAAALDGAERATSIGAPAFKTDALMSDVLALRSSDVATVQRILRRPAPLSGDVVSLVIALLDREDVASDAIRALRVVAERHGGQLVDALLEPRQSFAIRRRLPRVLSACGSQRAADGLMLGLEDPRFEVRYQCGRALRAMVDRNGRLSLHTDRVIEVVKSELNVSRSIWRNQKVVDRSEQDAHQGSTIEPAPGDRANHALAHVFNLLGLILPLEPLRVAFHGLSSTDIHLRGTALEYLYGALPPEIRELLWPLLDEDARPT